MTTLSTYRQRPRAVRVLGGIETRRQLRQPWVWIGAALTVVLMITPTTTWSGGSYSDDILAFIPLTLASLIGGYTAGRRDQSDVLAEPAPLTTADRTIARLASISVPVAVAIAMTVGVAVVSRIEGGYWIGDAPRRTDSALHPLLDLLQPVLVVALAGAFGVAAARQSRRRATTLLIVGGFALVMTFIGYWMWNIPPGHAITPLQVQPLTIDLDPAVTSADIPAGWLADAPGEHNNVWQRRVVHQPTIAAHDLYLVGLIMLTVAWALVGSPRRRRIALAGLVLTLLGVAIQLVLMRALTTGSGIT